MSSYLLTLIIRIVLTFGLLQVVAVGGCYVLFRPFTNKKKWALILGYLLALNSGWFFLFTPYACPAQVRMWLEYLLLFPFFVYMLICFMLAYFFLVAGTCILIWRLLHKLKIVLQTVRV
ncbi:MAG: hypothetical protein GY868_00775, partial [Deltaproteobacteria bacterium]|nr:hypothetical protein [Deltaproteobacteria bacterium]